jgi:oligoendopeptidase F
MNRSNVLPAYAEGPHYLFEAFAILNEFLLPDYLYNHETNPALKRYYLEQCLALTGMKMFVVTPKAMLEETVYDGVARGTIKGADDLDVLTKQIYSRFSIFPGNHGELKNQWMGIKLMFQDPFYDINYVYATLLALKFYEMYRRDPQHFVPRYIALLRNGFNAPPEVLLKRFLDIDLHDPRLLPDALKVLEGKLNLLEMSYRN